MTRNTQQALARQGRFASFLIAGTGIAWLLVLALGEELGWSQRTLAFFDLAAMASFAMALWLLFGVWRARRNNKE
ncbi:DUF5337 domain-containing protein [Pararhodobacter marinus]|uniref:DUF5337 domain-containing protein n=1 Tax=Pararhodobacter marinus TaxID=2184063 RepID=A0A2U2CGD3_9RHOB|nr:DUF5337 domain-containing protein [Pararhodobacter marinus]PWE30901.1 hypothetical protein C4N9_03875 [Pararhodobacter marinus]